MVQTVRGERIDLQGLDEQELTALVTGMGEPPYRARQIMHWLYRRCEADMSRMSDLPKAFRERLAAVAYVGRPAVEMVQTAGDGTRKYLLRLADGVHIEAVLIPDGPRLTACLSSQAGCGIGCAFCATAIGGLVRNLTASEIVGQLLVMQSDSPRRITHVVMMGMGEPLANYRAVLRAIRLMVDPKGVGLGQRHITVSTSGVVPGILRLADEGLQIGLAVSLHAPNDALRSQLVPLNKKYPLAELLAACREYVARTRRRITFEYVLIDGVNDGDGHAAELGRLLAGLLCHVNLIPLNPVPELGLRRPPRERIARFAKLARQAGLAVTVRKEMGVEIDAACGQLRRRLETPPVTV